MTFSLESVSLLANIWSSFCRFVYSAKDFNVVEYEVTLTRRLHEMYSSEFESLGKRGILSGSAVIEIVRIMSIVKQSYVLQ